MTPFITLTSEFRTYAAIYSALTNGQTDPEASVDSRYTPQVPIQLEVEKYDHVPPPPLDFAVSVWGRLLDGLGWLTGVGVPLLLGEPGVELVCDSTGDCCAVHQCQLQYQQARLGHDFHDRPAILPWSQNAERTVTP